MDNKITVAGRMLGWCAQKMQKNSKIVMQKAKKTQKKVLTLHLHILESYFNKLQ